MRDIADYTAKYNVKGFEDYQVKYRRRKVLEIIQENASDTILEIGCGSEPLFERINSSEYEKFVFVEPSKDFFENACNRIGSNTKVAGINDFFSCEIEEVKNNNWNIIVCSGLLHEVEKPGELLREIGRVCNKETIVHINVPNAKSLHRLIAYEAGLIDRVDDFSERNIEFQQHSVFSIDSLCSIAEECGFMILESGSYFPKPFTHDQMYRMIQTDIIDEKVLDGLFGLGKYLPEYGSEIYVNVKLKGE